ncbi:U11/U12 small nuclear ribonucleoprotein 25 kDa protein-like [Diadema setosum]|uniref:U11/U12 small nuclear ribonucleoprotein 25 kDa protein-like n=1 Tax=Diadema setosum TaxID=31175 RepID=UPI003B3A00D6
MDTGTVSTSARLKFSWILDESSKMEVVPLSSTSLGPSSHHHQPPLPPQSSASPQPPPDDHDSLPHVEAMSIFRRELQDLLDEDALLDNLPRDVRAEEVNLQIALEHGQAMTVNVRRADEKIMPIVVMQTATVRDLKNAIRRYIELQQDRDGTKKKLSWRYVWRAFYLAFDSEKLTEDRKKLKEYGIRNRAEVTFVKRLHSKAAGH